MAITFPAAPVVGQVYPVGAGTSGVSQWNWDGAKWNVVPVFVRTNNQLAFNAYEWPNADGTAGYQLQTDGAGNLSWSLEADCDIKALGITPLPDGANTIFTLVDFNTTVSYTPIPSSNILVFLGGVPQIPGAANAYTVIGDQITFVSAPAAGTSFYAVSSVVV